MPTLPPSRPGPDCFMPPNRTAGYETNPWLRPTIPVSGSRQAGSPDRCRVCRGNSRARTRRRWPSGASPDGGIGGEPEDDRSALCGPTHTGGSVRRDLPAGRLGRVPARARDGRLVLRGQPRGQQPHRVVRRAARPGRVHEQGVGSGPGRRGGSSPRNGSPARRRLGGASACCRDSVRRRVSAHQRRKSSLFIASSPTRCRVAGSSG